ncbi:MAG: transporter substrate-binding domain-containing protein [Bacteroidota bacterium]
MYNSFRNIFSSLFALLFLSALVACGGNNDDSGKVIHDNDLDEILKKGILTVLVENSSTSYLIYRGKKMGFEYEILREFADELGVKLEVKILSDLDKIPQLMAEKQADIVACNYTYSKDRAENVDFSIPYLVTPQVLVQRKNGFSTEKIPAVEYVAAPENLINKKIHVWENSSFHKRLVNLQEELGDTILIENVQGEIGNEEMIELVAEGMIDYTVSDQNLAAANAKFYDNLDVSTVLSVNQKICFGIRKNTPLLQARLDKWLDEYMKKASFRYLKNKYFELGYEASVKIKNNLINKRGVLSPYDAIFKKEARRYNYEWTLLASQAYQESQFDPLAVGFGGSYSMMQFMPAVGPNYDVYPDSPPEVQIAGGMRLMNKYYKRWSSIPDHEQRIKFSLASYNAGLGHVLDAIALAEKNGKNTKVWDNNVDEMMMNLSKQAYYRDPVVKNGAHRGMITYQYVHKIYYRHLEWKAMFK